MYKKFASSVVVICTFTFASSPVLAQFAGVHATSQARAVGGSNPLPQARAVGGSNPLPQAVGGSNPLPQAVAGSNPLPQAVVDDSSDDDLSQDDENWLWVLLSMLDIY